MVMHLHLCSVMSMGSFVTMWSHGCTDGRYCPHAILLGSDRVSYVNICGRIVGPEYNFKWYDHITSLSEVSPILEGYIQI